jgi:hypothetical protein
MRELDTAFDFVTYLRKKEALFRDVAVVATGEEDLLGQYLLTMDGAEHAFIPASEHPDMVMIDESAYSHLISLPQYQNSKRENEASYVWDRLIEHFVTNWKQGRLEQDVDLLTLEPSLRLMAAAGRVVRRTLGQRLIQTLQTPAGAVRYSATADLSNPGLIYGFIIVPRPSGASYEECRERRQLLMTVYGRSLKVRYPAAQKALLLATESQGIGKGSSEDLGVMEFSDWNDQLVAETRAHMAELGLEAEMKSFTTHEFPTGAERPGPSREALRRLRKLTKLKQKQHRENQDPTNGSE